MSSDGRTFAGISGSGGAAGTCDCGPVVLQACSADSASTKAGQPSLRFPIGFLPIFLSAASGVEDAKPADGLNPCLSNAWLTRRQSRNDPLIPAARYRSTLRQRIWPAQGGYGAI